MKSLKEIGNEIWSLSGDKNFSGKNNLTFVNRLTGEVVEFEQTAKYTKPEFIINNSGISELDTDEVYGCNGFKRATWQKAVFEKQEKQEKEFEEIA